MPMTRLAVTIDEQTFEIELRPERSSGNELQVVVDGAPLHVTLPEPNDAAPLIESLIVENRSYELQLDRDVRWIKGFGGLHRVEVRDLERTFARPISGDGRVKAPIPGRIARVLVAPGDEVVPGQALLVLEAMKMENQVRAPCAGFVVALHAGAGQDVALGALLAEISA
jgi:biotin carboxyl carrier protein